MARPQIHLEAVRIDGFRSCEGTALSPHRELSVLIGPNGSGKTNVLQGIALLAAWSAPGAAEAVRAAGRAQDDARVTAAFQLESETFTLRPATLTAITAFRQRIRYYSASRFTDPIQYPTGLGLAACHRFERVVSGVRAGG